MTSQIYEPNQFCVSFEKANYMKYIGTIQHVLQVLAQQLLKPFMNIRRRLTDYHYHLWNQLDHV